MAKRSANTPTSRPLSVASVVNHYELEGSIFDRSPPTPAPFDQSLDYSKMNAVRHNASRSNTFDTPSRLDKKNSPGDAFIKSLGKDILKEIRAEMQQTAVILHNDLANALQNMARARENSETTMMNILESVLTIQRDGVQTTHFREACVEPLRSLQKDCGEMAQQFSIQTSTLSQVVQSMQQHDELESVRLAQCHEDMEHVSKGGMEVQEVVQRSELQLGEVIGAQQSLQADAQQSLQALQKILQDNEEHHTRFENCLDAQFQIHLQGLSQDVERLIDDSSRMKAAVGQNYTVLFELRHMQQALNLDFDSHVLIAATGDLRKRRGQIAPEPDVASRRGFQRLPDADEKQDLAHSGTVRVREYWSQTDAMWGQDADTQTDAVPSITKTKKNMRQRQVAVALLDEKRQSSRPKPKNKMVFADAEAMKQQARKNLIHNLNVTDLYHKTGVFQKLARSSAFEQLTFFVIFLNAIWIAVDTDLNDADILINAHPVFQIVENGFCTYFTFELFTRFMAFKYKRSCFKDGWFIFDTVLVSMMIVETWVITLVLVALEGGSSAGLKSVSILRMARVVRLLRMTRMARLLRSVPELVILITGLAIAARSVFFFFLLLLAIIYVYAVAFTQLTKDSDIGKQYFRTVPDAMQSLLLDSILPESASIVTDMGRAHPLLFIAMLTFILLTTLTVMNMLVGVLVEVVAAVAATEKEGMTVSAVNYQLREAMYTLGISWEENPRISKKQFLDLVTEPEVAGILQQVGVDAIGLIEMIDVIYEDKIQNVSESVNSQTPSLTVEGLSFEDFLDVILTMRGTNPATVKDVEKQGRALRGKLDKFFHDLQTYLGESMETIRDQVTVMRTEDSEAESEV